MSVSIGKNGQRSVRAEIEVPGSPEEVWQAIATGPGISSWFLPTEVEERDGGVITTTFGPGMESAATITRWDPPLSYVKEGDGMSPDSPPVATEWVVEARSGGTCIVRVVHSWFASTDEWDGQWESVAQGWSSFFEILGLKLRYFLGLPCVAFDVTGMARGSESAAWEALTAPLGLAEAVEGQEVSANEPTLSGRVATVGKWDAKELMLLITEPGPGVCHFFAMPMGDQSYISIRFFLFGDGARKAVADAEQKWKRWFGERFPMG
jgi:uncharacterized protein YndB with AHSA1/START domain